MPGGASLNHRVSIPFCPCIAAVEQRFVVVVSSSQAPCLPCKHELISHMSTSTSIGTGTSISISIRICLHQSVQRHPKFALAQDTHQHQALDGWMASFCACLHTCAVRVPQQKDQVPLYTQSGSGCIAPYGLAFGYKDRLVVLHILAALMLPCSWSGTRLSIHIAR
ncbi:hypothetical protein HDV62DRAFT_106581 [Trichoderma sp. SZMC 28011]